MFKIFGTYICWIYI